VSRPVYPAGVAADGTSLAARSLRERQQTGPGGAITLHPVLSTEEEDSCPVGDSYPHISYEVSELRMARVRKVRRGFMRIVTSHKEHDNGDG
jgi:hypothetical protein